MAEISQLAIMQAELFIGIMSGNGVAIFAIWKYYRWKEKKQKGLV